MKIYYSFFKTQFGLCLAASTKQGVCNVLFADSKKELLADLKSRWPEAEFAEKNETAHAHIESYLNGSASKSKIKLFLQGTDFELNVWEALLTILSGKTSTYGEIAKKIGKEKSSRIVGRAIGNNPIGYLIPCHRVLKSNGEIGGYRWGTERKKKMLAFEMKKGTEEK